MHIRLALRRLAATPTFTIGAIAVLALGTGATLAVFTVLNALVMKTLPVPEPGRLVAIEVQNGRGEPSAFPRPLFDAFIARQQSLGHVSGVLGGSVVSVEAGGSVHQAVGNAGPYYPHDRFGEVDGEPVEGWWHNAQAHPLLLHYSSGAGGELYDAHAAAGQAHDVAQLDQLPPFGPAYLAEPYGDASLCDVLVGVMTATDCNSLYFEQYAGTEYPARLDHVMVRDGQARVRVQQSAVVHTEPLPGTSFERSDHYGVAVTLLLASGGE